MYNARKYAHRFFLIAITLCNFGYIWCPLSDLLPQDIKSACKDFYKNDSSDLSESSDYENYVILSEESWKASFRSALRDGNPDKMRALFNSSSISNILNISGNNLCNNPEQVKQFYTRVLSEVYQYVVPYIVTKEEPDSFTERTLFAFAFGADRVGIAIGEHMGTCLDTESIIININGCAWSYIWWSDFKQNIKDTINMRDFSPDKFVLKLFERDMLSEAKAYEIAQIIITQKPIYTNPFARTYVTDDPEGVLVNNFAKAYITVNNWLALRKITGRKRQRDGTYSNPFDSCVVPDVFPDDTSGLLDNMLSEAADYWLIT